MTISASVTTKRKEWIDILRAVAMLLVIYGHMLSGKGHSEYYIITSAVKIPLFFVISGYLFNVDHKRPRVFFSNLTKNLIVPFMFFSLVLMPVKVCAAHYNLINHSVRDVFISFITGNELWYLPCCIIAEMLFYCIIRLSKRNLDLILSCLGLAIVGFILSQHNILSIANFNTALIAQLFLLIGYIFQKNENWFDDNWLIVCMTCLLIYVLLCVVSFILFPGESMDIHRNIYYSIPINIGTIITGNILLMCMGKHYSLHSSVFSFIGKNTLAFYAIHEYIIATLRILLKMVGIKESGSYIFEFVLMIVVCNCCALVSCFFNRFLPFAVAKKKSVVRSIS